MDGLQVCHRYDMILGHRILYKLNTDFCFYNIIIRGNGGADEGCNAQFFFKQISICRLIGLKKKYF